MGRTDRRAAERATGEALAEREQSDRAAILDELCAPRVEIAKLKNAESRPGQGR